MFCEFKEVPYQIWGPWRNRWGYITEVAQFGDEDLILKSSTPYNKKIVADQIFKDPALNKAAHAYIDAQTQFAKMAVNNTIEMAKYSVESVSKVLFPKKEGTA